jgi:hypothetical protein
VPWFSLAALGRLNHWLRKARSVDLAAGTFPASWATTEEAQDRVNSSLWVTVCLRSSALGFDRQY